jgi:hypothetical protein
MKSRTLTLNAFIQTLTEAASFADKKLRDDYVAKMNELENCSFRAMPEALRIASMKVSFSPDVAVQKDNNDLILDFSKSKGNFTGEIVFRACGSDMNADLVIASGSADRS